MAFFQPKMDFYVLFLLGRLEALLSWNIRSNHSPRFKRRIFNDKRTCAQMQLFHGAFFRLGRNFFIWNFQVLIDIVWYVHPRASKSIYLRISLSPAFCTLFNQLFVSKCKRCLERRNSYFHFFFIRRVITSHKYRNAKRICCDAADQSRWHSTLIHIHEFFFIEYTWRNERIRIRSERRTPYILKVRTLMSKRCTRKKHNENQNEKCCKTYIQQDILIYRSVMENIDV